MKNQKLRRILRMLGLTLTILLLLVGMLCLFSDLWYIRVFGRTGFDSILFTLTGGLGGTQGGMIASYLIGALLPTVLLTLTVVLLLFLPRHWKVHAWPLSRSCCVCLVLSLLLLGYAAVDSGLAAYAVSYFQESTLYEDEYKDPSQVSVTFPEQKRNLIYILLESMETSYFSRDEGGALEYNLIPELYSLAQDNINFSDNDSVGGFQETTGTSWTVGSMVGQTAGIPLKTPSNVEDWQNGYGTNGNFLPGATTLQNILHDNGYYQALMVGSSSSFGGRSVYYSTHGTDKIYDIYTARQDGIVPSDYFVWWGMEDLYLFEYAKQELTKISQQDQPFAFTMLTVDTHHVGGYTCALCGDEHEESLENAISCSSRQVYAFVQWLMEQPFYENTTIVITGDHCSMDNGYFERNVDADYSRHVYNCFINSAVEPARSKNRQFCAMDMFPTTLAAMGCTVSGERLGLGTNLFSNQSTLTERMGYYTLKAELAGNNSFYQEHFFAPEDRDEE